MNFDKMNTLKLNSEKYILIAVDILFKKLIRTQNTFFHVCIK